MAVAVQQSLFRQWAERQAEIPLLVLARDEFLEQKRVGSQRVDRFPLEQSRQFVAECKKTTWLEPDDRDPACNIRSKDVHRALHFAPRFIDQPDRKESAATTQRAI